MDIKKIQVFLKKHQKIKEMSDFVEAEKKKLKAEEEAIADEILKSGMTDISLDGKKVKPTSRVIFGAPAKADLASKNAIKQWTVDNLGQSEWDSLWNILYTDVAYLHEVATKEKMIKAGEYLPGIKFSKTNFKLSITKK